MWRCGCAKTPDLTAKRSDPVMRYEEKRAERVLHWLESRWPEKPPWNLTALTLACAVDIACDRGMGSNWAGIAPQVITWVKAQAALPAMRETAPGPV